MVKNIIKHKPDQELLKQFTFHKNEVYREKIEVTKLKE